MTISVPAIVVTGAPDSNESAFLLVRYRKNGVTDWAYAPAAACSYGVAVRVEITSVTAATVYNVEVAYVSVRNEQPASWLALANVTTGASVAGAIDGQGDLATLDDVDTPQLMLNAATNLGGSVTVSPTSVAYRGSTRTTWTKVDEITFTASGEGEIFVQWNGTISWNQNSSTECPLFMTDNGASPSATNIAGTWYYSNYVARVPAKGNQNALACGYTLTDMQARPAGSITMQIWGQAENNTGSLPVIEAGASFFVFEAKR